VYRYVVKFPDDFWFPGQSFSYFVIFLHRFWEGHVQGTCCIYYKFCFVLCIGKRHTTSVERYRLTNYNIPVPTYKHRFRFACTVRKGYFHQVACTLWQSAGELFLPVGCVCRDVRVRILMSTKLLHVQLFRSLYHIFCIIIIIIIIIITIIIIIRYGCVLSQAFSARYFS